MNSNSRENMNSMCWIVDKSPQFLKTVNKCTNCKVSELDHSTDSRGKTAQFCDSQEIGITNECAEITDTHQREVRVEFVAAKAERPHDKTRDTVTNRVRRRRAYTREEKLDAIDFYRKCGLNKYKTCKKWKIDSRSLTRWIKDETKIRQLRPGKMAARFRTAKYPVMEEELHQEYCNMLDIGKKVDTLWLREKAQEIMKKLSPRAEFKFSACWLRAFKRRYGISFREKKECAEIFPLPTMTYY